MPQSIDTKRPSRKPDTKRVNKPQTIKRNEERRAKSRGRLFQ